jgi:hypothetical protein
MTKKIISLKFKFDYNMFANDIQAQCDALGLRYSDVDKLAGIGSGATGNIVRGSRNNKMNTWLAIANALDMDVRTYFVLDV